MQRVCFQLYVRPERLDEYVERHSAVWPDMLREIAAAGRRNYSLYLADGGMLIGYYETDDDRAAQHYLADSGVAGRWEAEMAEFFVPQPGEGASSGRPDQVSLPLREVFNLADQLSQN